MAQGRAERWVFVALTAALAAAVVGLGGSILLSKGEQDRIEVLAWMVLILPLAGFVVLAAFGGWIKRDREETGAGILACGSVVASFLLALWMASTFIGFERGIQVTGRLDQHVQYLDQQGISAAERDEILSRVGRTVALTPAVPAPADWLSVGSLRVPFALLIDRLSLLMVLIVTGIGALIHIYSLGYMARDPERVRYFSYLNLFTFFMLLLVLSASLPLMFVGWEGVGLCSYLLIGFWFSKKSAAAAGQKAFLYNRVGDAALIVAVILAFHVFGTTDLLRVVNPNSNAGLPHTGILAQLEAMPRESFGSFGPLTVIALLFFIGACGKSAQIPLHVWLPDAMEGPTPVSALIHAATMVTAGVYLVSRLSVLYMRAPTTLLVVALVGLATALMAGTVALVQTDIKRVLAYSTISQLGFMFLACGVGFFGVAIFHLFTHAFFKALLFLAAGSVIHALSGEQDLRHMGGLWKRLPWTFWTFVAGAASIAGVPFLSGYMSKEEILAATAIGGNGWLLGLALAAAALTAFYMARLVSLAFFGAFRGGDEQRAHLHESPWTMRVPLIVLALGAVAAGYFAVPDQLVSVMAGFRVPKGGHGLWLPVLASALAILAIVSATYLYLVFGGAVEWVRARFRLVARVIEAKWGFDLAFDWFARRVVIGGSSSILWRRLDAGLVDGAVNGTARLVGATAARLRAWQTGLVRQYALVLFGGAALLLAYLVWR